MKKESHIMVPDLPLRDDQFALILNNKEGTYRLFPTATTQQIRESVSEFEKFASDFSEREASTAAYFLKQACLTRGIQPGNLIEKVAAQSCDSNCSHNDHVASYEPPQPHHYALGGQYVIDTPEHLKLAQVYFQQHLGDFEENDKRAFARSVFNRASDLGVDIDEHIAKYANPEIDRISLNLQVQARKMECKEQRDVDDYNKLASYVGEVSPYEFVELMERLDKRAGLNRFYGRAFAAPSDGILKAAQAPIWTTEANGRVFTSLDLRRALENPEVATLYGQGIVDQLRSNPEIFSSLPKPERESILSYAQ